MNIQKSLNLLKLLLVFEIIIPQSCTNQKSDEKSEKNVVRPYPHIIDITEGFNKPSQFKLSEIADSISYIVLSHDKKELIGDISKIQITDSNIYIQKSDGLIARFGRTGKYLNSYGNLGRGPKEYLPGSVYSTTPEDDKIYIFRSGMDSYLTYESDGRYIDTRKFNIPRTMFRFYSISDSNFFCTFFYVGSLMKDYIINAIDWTAGLFDSKGNPLTVIEHPLKNVKISESENSKIVSMAPSITYFNNKIVMKPSGDTIYEVQADSIYKGFILNWGHLPHQEGNELYFRQSGSSNNLSVSSVILETSEKAYLRISSANDSYIFEYNKITGETKSMLQDRDNSGFINDIDGGQNFYPHYTNRLGNMWVINQDAYSFKENHHSDFLNKSIAITQEMKDKLISFTNGLAQDDNPVIKILYLKIPKQKQQPSF